ncbi:uncharacterized protein LOC130676796 [Microplitis mediator]|uniref:uncharacterized protein LOC130676796 n=1 Tax=Microplitis mediator TaxID=375433 RepID=UPI002556F48C|nr:uncharacterized protein LOC130676796 [Microplitis mediator]
MAYPINQQETCNKFESIHHSCDCCKKKREKIMLEQIKPSSSLLVDNNFHLDNKIKNAFNVMKERFEDLTERRQFLIEKVGNIEKIMPLLMAYNISSDSSSSSSTNKIENIVDIISPYPTQDDDNNLNEETKNSINSLNEQVDKLYDEIIKTDIELQESIMRLESLQAVNFELENKLSSMRNNNQSSELMTLHNLYLIITQNNSDNDDYIINCLPKLRQFIQQEIRLKKCINVLENREQCLSTQLDKLLLKDKNHEFKTMAKPTNKFQKQCIGKNYRQWENNKFFRSCECPKKKIAGNNDDDNIDIDLSKYCDCCPLNKK